MSGAVDTVGSDRTNSTISNSSPRSCSSARLSRDDVATCAPGSTGRKASSQANRRKNLKRELEEKINSTENRAMKRIRVSSLSHDDLEPWEKRKIDAAYDQYRSDMELWDMIDFFHGAPRTGESEITATHNNRSKKDAIAIGSKQNDATKSLERNESKKCPEKRRLETNSGQRESEQDELAASSQGNSGKQSRAMEIKLREEQKAKKNKLGKDVMRQLEKQRPLGPDWKGVKILGSGAMGMASLWEYQGAHLLYRGRRAVIKPTYEHDLREEKDIMLRLGDKRVNKHVVHLLFSENGGDKRAVQQIILEFCEGGDMLDLLIAHRQKKEPIAEQTLWVIFECFTKGLSILDHTTEGPERDFNDRDPICHLDLKPENILLGATDALHPLFPICKIADFGLASIVQGKSIGWDNRDGGSFGYNAPEQFSKRWEHLTPDPGQADSWGTLLNIWQAGCIMYQLATLRAPPKPEEFRPSAIERKRTYGPDLERAAYSKALKSLIWGCLCEEPKNRPQLATLHKEIAIGIAATKDQLPGKSQTWCRREPSAPPQETTIPKPRAQVTPAGTKAAPFVIRSSTTSESAATTGGMFDFCVIRDAGVLDGPDLIWFRASSNSSVAELKDAIQKFGWPGFRDLPHGAQVFSLDIPGQSSRIFYHDSDSLWGCGAWYSSRIELPKVIGEEEPDEDEVEGDEIEGDEIKEVVVNKGKSEEEP